MAKKLGHPIAVSVNEGRIWVVPAYIADASCPIKRQGHDYNFYRGFHAGWRAYQKLLKKLARQFDEPRKS